MNKGPFLAGALTLLIWGQAPAENDMYVTAAFANVDDPRSAGVTTDPLYSTYLDSTNHLGTGSVFTAPAPGTLTNVPPAALPTREPLTFEPETPNPAPATNAPATGARPS